MGEQQQSANNQPAVSRERVAATSGDVLAAQVAKLAELFPEAVVEGRVDFDKLKATLGGAAESGPGRFSFTWAGKDDAISLLQTPTRGTLVPCPEQSVNFDATANAFIEGENLEVLKLLFKPYFGRVKLCYIDPPYNTGQDFVYPDDFADPLHNYLVQTGQVDDAGNLVSSKVDRAGRVHSGWLSMMYPRLFLARQLLRDDGVICVSIDDHEVHHLRMLMDEVFGAENFITTIIWQKVYAPKNSAQHFSEDHDYIVVYARDAQTWRPTLLPRTEEANARYENPDDDVRGVWKAGDLTARNYYADGQYEVTGPTGRKFKPPLGAYWRVNATKFQEWDADKRIWWGPTGDNMPAMKRFLTEVKQGMTPQTLWTYDEVGHTQEAKKELLEYVHYADTDNVLDTVKPTRLLKRVLQVATTPTGGDLVVDFFAGSCSTAHAVLALNREDSGDRRFLAVQFPEPLPTPEAKLKTMADVGRMRLTHVIDRFRQDGQGQLADVERATPEDLGFKVFKLAEPAIRPWSAGDESRDPDAYADRLSFYNDPLSPGAEPGDVVWEVALREGYSLATRLDRRELANGNMVWTASDPATGQRMLVCLEPTVRADLSKQLELTADTLLVVRDVALDDTAAANLALQCRLKTI
jgi:adenine-specific DNA-methyltransferase